MTSKSSQFLWIFLLVPMMGFAFECEDRRDITSEKDEKLVFCTVNKLQLTQKCAQDETNCALVKDLKVSPEKKKLEKAMTHSTVGTTGSRICNLKGWTVLMGEMFDKSQVCTCKHPSGESIACVSLDEYYR